MTDTRHNAQEMLWVFGYGSLMWNPGFAYEERVLASLPGYARTFCMWSIHHRGTEENPGLVLALDPHEDAHCRGLGFAVAPEQEEATLAYLRERELISSAYLETWVTLELADGRDVRAVAYVVDTEHVQYCGGLPLEKQADVIAHAVGGRGPNTEYLYNTQSHLDELGIEDDDLRWLAERVRQLTELRG
ncbi:gamma-glutamylcyclotransferase [Pseudoruegeria sp. HB172150]|uniref:gamma-glutamylcyclotransferase n=1 Tax=Pseudoruegeria sp. HB172150 TaxID=2721164 RepID=UPI0020A657C0|nr:gamma-glutamylcyclotransferase [Pseudoruegeria sp. HB172150]